ncbi:MAG: GNAT family N-acetyltransferase [Alphaproteobacteria bacterium]|nr:GNAT family N-acetyltransferase [Alphaproteobacteria bacterium]
MKDITIIPIFNQAAPGVWEDFAHIHADTMRTNYNYIIDSAEMSDAIVADRRKWTRGTHFAFGAYDDGNMIGYIQGDATGRCATIQSLYVLFEYQKMHVGRDLLRYAERAVKLFANRTELIALTKAEPFYRAQGYRNLYSNVYAKDIADAPRCECLPVFKCSRPLANKCIALNPEFDASAVNKEHQSLFVYFDVDSKVIGYAAGNDIVVNPSSGLSNIVRANLQRNISKIR